MKYSNQNGQSLLNIDNTAPTITMTYTGVRVPFDIGPQLESKLFLKEIFS